MLLLTAKNIKKNFSEKPLLENVNMSINEGDKVGLVGVNGSGKSTLLKIIAGDIEPEGGELLTSNDLRIAYLPQNPVYNPDMSVLEQALDYVNNGVHSIGSKAEQSANYSQSNGLRGGGFGHAVEDYEVMTMLTKLHMDDYDKPMKELSGGQRKRVALAAVICADSNLLILDEPTNHMDNDIIEWLEERLCDYKGAVFMITHDRYFLERITNHIVEIEKGKLVCYEGNYETYLTAKAERHEMAVANERKRANLYRKELKWIRWTAPARTTKSKSRVDRFKQIEAAKENFDEPQLQLEAISSRLGKKIIEIKSVSKSYDGIKYIDDFTYTILRNDRIGIVGNNGCGKTTLLRMIMGQVEPDAGSIEIGDTVKIGYFSQESEEMDPNLRVIKYVEEIASNIKTRDGYVSASQMLERFLFPTHMHSVKIEKLSGGEKRRLYLLTVLMKAPNILVLDEPTNDLDIDTLTVLEDYLDDFPGAVLIVSHDRYFLDRLVVRTFAFEDGGHIGHYTGGYSKYMNDKEAREAEASVNAANTAGGNAANKASEKVANKTGENATNKASGNATGDGRNSRAPKLKFSYAEKKEYETIDDDIALLESGIADIDEEMQANATNSMLLSELSEKKQTLEAELADKYDRWEYLNELAEKIDRGLRIGE